MKNSISTLFLLIFISLTFLEFSKAELLLVGGGLTDDNAAVIGRFVDLAGGVGKAKIGCITTAAADPLDSGTYYENLFMTYGAASATYIPVTETSNNADSQQIVDLINQQTGFFFGGGDQARVTAAWLKSDGSDTLGLKAMRTIFDNGGAVGGTSAGATCQNTGPMIEGGLSYEALRYRAYPGGYNPSYPDYLCYLESGGLRFLPGFLIDTHYSQRGREGRIIELLLDTNLKHAIAVDENTGVQISSNGDAEVLGNAGGVMIVDLTEAVRNPGTYTSVSGVRLSFFTESDKFNINTLSATYAPWKGNNTGREYYNNAVSSNNIFSSPNKLIREYSVFRTTAHRLWDSKDSSIKSYSFESKPQFSVNMMKSDGVAYGGYSSTDNVFQVSYNRMVIDIDNTP